MIESIIDQYVQFSESIVGRDGSNGNIDEKNQNESYY